MVIAVAYGHLTIAAPYLRVLMHFLGGVPLDHCTSTMHPQLAYI